MPPKVPKKPLKSMEKVEKPVVHIKKAKKKNYQNFGIYLYRIFKSIVPENMNVSRNSMGIMNNFLNDMIERIAVEASRLVAHGKKTTMTSRDVQSAVKLLVPGELGKHANSEGMKALSLYHNSRTKD